MEGVSKMKIKKCNYCKTVCTSGFSHGIKEHYHVIKKKSTWITIFELFGFKIQKLETSIIKEPKTRIVEKTICIDCHIKIENLDSLTSDFNNKKYFQIMGK